MGIKSRLAGLFRRSEPRGARVLLYHRVFSPEIDPQLLCVSPENFDAHMRWLAANCDLVPLGEMFERMQSSKLTGKTVAVTFDDGYVDNLDQAKAILESHRVPATIFVSSGFVESNREMWWDDLERLLLLNANLPDDLILVIGADRFQWDLRGSVPDRAWNVGKTPSTGAQEAYHAISWKLRYLNANAREDVLQQIRRQTSASADARPEYRGITAAELKRLASTHIEIGGHTIDHVALSSLPRDEQVSQIRADKARIEAMLGTGITAFAYPYGTRAEYDSVTLEAVNAAGYRYACANIPGAVREGVGRLEIPRQIVRNWDPLAFERAMHEWLA